MNHPPLSSAPIPANHTMRSIEFAHDYTPHALASVLTKADRTQIITACNYQGDIPHWMRTDKTRGWVNAEYSLLPSSTHIRHKRERHHPSGRTFEIQRMLSRALRSAVNLNAIPQQTLLFDCDVISADGGTRTTSLNGCMAALILANHRLVAQGKVAHNSLITNTIAAVSIAIKDGQLFADPNYEIDSTADADITVVMNSHGELVEFQGCAEQKTFSHHMMMDVFELAQSSLTAVFNQLEEFKHTIEGTA